jgi:hypothetical protein
MYTETQRKFKEVDTSLIYTLYQNQNTKSYKLIFEDNKNPADPVNGTEINGFYLTCIGIDLKLNTGKTIKLQTNEFYNLKEGEKITHVKRVNHKKFVKAK